MDGVSLTAQLVKLHHDLLVIDPEEAANFNRQSSDLTLRAHQDLFDFSNALAARTVDIQVFKLIHRQVETLDHHGFVLDLDQRRNGADGEPSCQLRRPTL